MEMKTNKAGKRFKMLFYFLLTLFIFLYFASLSGYYEKKVANDTILTKEAIKAFEKDVAEGENVDIKDYIIKDDNDYKSLSSKVGYTVSNTIDTILNDGVRYIVKFLKTLFS